MSVTKSPSIYSYCFRGKTTGRYYFFAASAMPAVLLDATGNSILEISSAPYTGGSFGSEYLVRCSQTGEMRRGTKGSPDPAHPYSPGYAASEWENTTH